MKIQHWAIIFIIIMFPFSIVCRNTINKKILVLQEESRYNNINDNATYDAASQIRELFEQYMETEVNSKNFPLTEEIRQAAVDRFFNTLCINFNLPFGKEQAEAYFGQYIPALIVIGYDGLYVYSYEVVDDEYKFFWKPKIPYSYNYNGVLINFTLDNYVKIFASSLGKDYRFSQGYTLVDGSNQGTYLIGGYVGENMDYDFDGNNDFEQGLDNNYGIPLVSEKKENYDTSTSPSERQTVTDFVRNSLSTYSLQSENNDGNLSYFLYEYGFATGAWFGNSGTEAEFCRNLENLLITDDKVELSHLRARDAKVNFEAVNVDYQFDDNNQIIPGTDASEFHKLRRETIINTITKTLVDEFNEHNTIAHAMGLTYTFNIPDISRDEWNNTIDDVSVLSFIQGLPMGPDSFYNNYSLGGARIVESLEYYGEIVNDFSDPDNKDNRHRVYHVEGCKLLPMINGKYIVGVGRATTDPYSNPMEDYLKDPFFGTPEYNIDPDHVTPTNPNYDKTVIKNIYLLYELMNTGTTQEDRLKNRDFILKAYHGKNGPPEYNTYKNGKQRLSSGVVFSTFSIDQCRQMGFYPCKECCL